MPIIDLDRNRQGPLYRQVKAGVIRQIRLGALRPGDRLPPTRQLAQDLGVNRGTVSAAYDELLADGVLASHVGRGTFVSEAFDPLSLGGGNAGGRYRWKEHFAGSTPPQRRDFPQTMGEVIPFHRNVPDPALFPNEAFQDSLNHVMETTGAELLSYAPSAGSPEFVSFVRDHLAEHRQVPAGPNEILVVNGSQQALDLVCRAFLRPGDTVAVEDPTYGGALDLFQSFGVRVVGIGLDEQGLIMQEAEVVLARERPKFIYTMPTFHNPTGRCLSSGRRRDLVKLAKNYEIPLIEDDFDGELAYQGPPPPALRGEPGGEDVIYLGTPSKMLFPGLRLGWIAAPPKVVSHLGRIKELADLSGSPLLQAALSHFAGTGGLKMHTERVRRVYEEKRNRLLDALERFMPAGTTWSRPQGGMTLMVTLPPGLSAEDVLAEAAAEGILFTPGAWFSVNDGSRQLRLCYGSVDLDKIDEGVEKLARAVARTERTALRQGIGNNALPAV